MRVVVVTGSYPHEKMGGAEYQTMLLARGLMRRGHQVLFLASHTLEEARGEIDGLPIVRLEGWRITGKQAHEEKIARVLQDFNPDVCYVRVFDELSIVLPLCKRLKIRVVSVSCHMRETTPFLLGYYPMETVAYLRSRETFLHWQSFRAIKDSDLHVCNLQALETSMRRWYPKKQMRTIYNGSTMPPVSANFQKTPSGQVLWVNNIRRWKRPEVFVKLAQQLPDYRFVMIGRMSGSRTYARKLEALFANAPKNFEFLGPRPVEVVNEYICESDLLMYTSLPVEGFGNSFLQAWFRQTPTVSYEFELDGILEREDVGCCAQSFDELVRDVDELMRHDEQRLAMGARARQYAVENYQAERMVADYEAAFEDLVERVSHVS